MDHTNSSIEYKGDFYEEIGDFIKDNYLNYGFTKGTAQEVDFLIAEMNLQPDTRILDIGCGPGRHSLELARRGIQTVGVDISSEFIKYANGVALGDKLNAEFVVADARELAFSQEFDGAICLCEGAFGLAGSEKNHRKVLRGVHQALRAGSLFILTVINAYNVVRNLNDESLFDAYTCTKVDKEVILNPEGESKEVSIYTTAFTFRELKLLLESEGFEVEAAYDCTAGQFGTNPLKADSMEIMMVSRRK